MKYYKILRDSHFVGVITSSAFVAENARTRWLLTSDETLGQFVTFGGQLYRDYWMQPLYNVDRDYLNATISEITEAEYDTLKEAVEKDEPIEDDDVPEEPSIVADPVETDITLEYCRASKLTEMSRTCRQLIEAGFDIELEDGLSHHFSLDTQDQLNLITLSALAEVQDQIPYHADGELCKFFTAAEIKQIVAAATAFKTYHTTYHNALKSYINSLAIMEDIAAVTYGMEIPELYKSDVLRAITQ